MLPLTNFSKGAISPELQARIDTSQYAAGVRQLRNFIIQRYGGCSFRPGFRFAGEVEDVATSPRYVPFQYNIEQAYVMAFDDEKLNLLAGGGMVIEENVKITAITKAVNAQVTAAYHAYVVGERIYFPPDIVGMTELNGRFATVVSVVNANNFTIDIDTTGFTTFVSSGGATRVGAPPPPPAAPPPPPVPPPLPDEPEIGGGGGSGSDLGDRGNRYDDGTYR